jgi:hypothetical protein
MDIYYLLIIYFPTPEGVPVQHVMKYVEWLDFGQES